MVKNITTSQLDFLSLEEVSDKAAETISGGITFEDLNANAEGDMNVVLIEAGEVTFTIEGGGLGGIGGGNDDSNGPGIGGGALSGLSGGLM